MMWMDGEDGETIGVFMAISTNQSTVMAKYGSVENYGDTAACISNLISGPAVLGPIWQRNQVIADEELHKAALWIAEEGKMERVSVCSQRQRQTSETGCDQRFFMRWSKSLNGPVGTWLLYLSDLF
jgi:hypothetical protein